MAESLHSVRFPGESAEYREARNQLLQAEMDLRERMESVARLRRSLPRGGRVPQDYEFEEWNGSVKRRTKLSELFAPGKDSLVVYSFMYGPTAEHACPMCTSFLDGLDRYALHVTQRVNLVVVAKSPIERVHAWAEKRGWSRLRLLSSAGTVTTRTTSRRRPTVPRCPRATCSPRPATASFTSGRRRCCTCRSTVTRGTSTSCGRSGASSI